MSEMSLPLSEIKPVLSQRSGKYSIRRKYLKLAIVVSSLLSLFATLTLIFVFFEINQNSYNLELNRIKSIFPSIERAIENDILIGNINELKSTLSYLKRAYNLAVIDVDKSHMVCSNDTVLIKKFACNTFAIDRFKEPVYVKIMNKVEREELEYLIQLSILIYALLFIIALLVLYFSFNKISKLLIDPLIQLAKNPAKSVANIHYEVSEIELIRLYLADYYNKLNEVRIQDEKIKIQDAINEISLQIVHDLRSPIAALNTLKNYANFNLDTHKDILENCVKRMECLVGELLYDNRRKIADFFDSNELMMTNITEIIISIINEKTILLNHGNKLIQINMNTHDCVHGYIDRNKICNIISNLLNNSIESINKSGQIDVNISTINDLVYIEIIDDGTGIPAIVFETLGTRKVSINKTNGSGIGLYSAFHYLKSIGGDLEIRNNLLAGASVSIRIPCNNLMVRNEPLIELDKSKKIVLFDDSILVTDTWKIKALEHGVDFYGFNELEPFISFTENLDKSTIIYVDSNLENGLKGEEIIKQLHSKGFYNLYIATGYEKEKYNNCPYIKGVIGKVPPFG